MALEHTFRVAIYDEFLDSFASIPRAQQKKVNKFVRKFREDPTNPSINYESINTFKDQNLKTVRIDQSYRAIVLKPEIGNVYVLLWVDNHDDAMRWASRKKVAIHPETGSLQVITGESVSSGATSEPAQKQDPLFNKIRDREMMRLGVPQEQIAMVRGIFEQQQLEDLSSLLPSEAFEALWWLSEGETIEEVEAAMAVSAIAEVDTTDFEAALDRDASKRHFVTVEDDTTLEAMLDEPLDKWRIFLHPSQRKLVYRNWNGPVRVLGGAGTGKSVVAMHRAAYLAEHVFNQPNDKLLFTTFTSNLAHDTRDNLAKLCTPEVLARIEVIHLDKWVRNLLHSAGYKYEIKWWGQTNELGDLWEQAVSLGAGLGFSPGFFRDEWELVVQAQGCTSWEGYKKAARAGRGVRMSRTKRKQVWPVFEEYRHLLEKRSLREPEDALRDATKLIKDGKVRVQLRSILVDEAQDMSTHAFSLLRAAIPEQQPNDMFIVGDGHQRIYRKRVVLSRAGVNIRGRGRRLRINYRTTDEIRRFAVSLLEGVDFDDLDAGQDSKVGYRSLVHGKTPDVILSDTFEDEVESIAEWLTGAELSRCCLVARTNKLVGQYKEALEDRGIQTRILKAGASDNRVKPGLRIATMHRVKGLEYDRMVIAGVTNKMMPFHISVQQTSDVAVRRDAELMERALLYVAITRARRAALVTAHGTMSQWITQPKKPKTKNHT